MQAFDVFECVRREVHAAGGGNDVAQDDRDPALLRDHADFPIDLRGDLCVEILALLAQLEDLRLRAALRTRIQQLHDDYQKRFQDDAKTTIADFEKTRADLSRRYAELHGVDVSAQHGAHAQILALRKKREDLYDEITGQIDREVRLIAQQRGISVVLSDVVAPAGGVDLTPDALKDIESLHE